MNLEQNKNKIASSGTATLLVIILILRITSYFMLSESVLITQIVKVGLRFFVTSLAGVLFLIQYRKPNFHLSITQPLPVLFYLAYLFLGLSSLLWTSSFGDSALQLLMDVEGFVFAFLFTKVWMENYAVTGFRLSRLLALSIGIIITTFIIGMIVNPELFYRQTHGGEESRLGGFIINPNELGMLIGVGIAATITEIKMMSKKIIPVATLCMLIYALVLTGSRSSMIALILIVLFFIARTDSLKLRLATIVAMLVAIPYAIKTVIFKQGNVDEVLNMTGRIPFWKDLLAINFPREPLLGYGYMRIDYTDKFESLNAYAGAMTHNTFLQALMGLGLVGLTIVLAQLSLTIYSIIKTTHAYKRRISIAMMIPLLINSFTEFGIFGETNYGIMFYLMIVFMMSMEPAEEKLQLRKSTTHQAKASAFFENPLATMPVLSRV